MGENIMTFERNNMVSATQIAGGTYLGYQGIKHGLPRVFGIRIENHTTSKKNAKLIKNCDGFLTPDFGGTGYSAKTGYGSCINNSKEYVHITGAHPDGKFEKMFKNFPECVRDINSSLMRKSNNLMYRLFADISTEEFQELNAPKTTNKTKLKWCLKKIGKNIFSDKTKKLYIPGIDSYFTDNFVPDRDSIMAIKSSKPIKTYNNRFTAMAAGLKKFGLTGIKENKSRVIFGIALLSLGVYYGIKLIKKGMNNLS